MTFFSISRWRPTHLLFSWCVYWLAVLIAAIGPAIPAILRATKVPNGHGEINASVGDWVMSLTVKELGQVTWTGSVHMLTAALWLGVPPLLLWILWVRARGAALTGERAQARS